MLFFFEKLLFFFGCATFFEKKKLLFATLLFRIWKPTFNNFFRCRCLFFPAVWSECWLSVIFFFARDADDLRDGVAYVNRWQKHHLHDSPRGMCRAMCRRGSGGNFHRRMVDTCFSANRSRNCVTTIWFLQQYFLGGFLLIFIIGISENVFGWLFFSCFDHFHRVPAPMFPFHNLKKKSGPSAGLSGWAVCFLGQWSLWPMLFRPMQFRVHCHLGQFLDSSQFLPIITLNLETPKI